ncbi:hypothetical protein [Paenibacillus sp. TY11]|uniref:hypothetical protein n=1 Tax=Paenibacillus sp. TY11 TaxID=3448633 RepID=UPI00403A45A3
MKSEKTRLYQKPLSGLNVTVAQQGNMDFKLNFTDLQQPTKLEECIESIMSSQQSLMKFFKNPKAYFKKISIGYIDIDRDRNDIRKLLISAEPEIGESILNRNAVKFVEVLKKNRMLSDKFIIKADADAEPQALAAAVAVTPAIVYTSLGVIAQVGLAVTAAAAIGLAIVTSVKVYGAASQKFQSLNFSKETPSVLAMAELLADSEFAAKVDGVLIDQFNVELNELFPGLQQKLAINPIM